MQISHSFIEFDEFIENRKGSELIMGICVFFTPRNISYKNESMPKNRSGYWETARSGNCNSLPGEYLSKALPGCSDRWAIWCKVVV